MEDLKFSVYWIQFFNLYKGLDIYPTLRRGNDEPIHLHQWKEVEELVTCNSCLIASALGGKAKILLAIAFSKRGEGLGEDVFFLLNSKIQITLLDRYV